MSEKAKVIQISLYEGRREAKRQQREFYRKVLELKKDIEAGKFHPAWLKKP